MTNLASGALHYQKKENKKIMCMKYTTTVTWCPDSCSPGLITVLSLPSSQIQIHMPSFFRDCRHFPHGVHLHYNAETDEECRNNTHKYESRHLSYLFHKHFLWVWVTFMRCWQEILNGWWWWRHLGLLHSTISISFQPKGICQPVPNTPAGKGLSVSTVLWKEWLGWKGIQGSVVDRKC